MLILSRKNRESVVIGGVDGSHRLLKVTVMDITGGRVRLGFEVDVDVPVHRAEVWERIMAEGSEDPDRHAEGALPFTSRMLPPIGQRDASEVLRMTTPALSNHPSDRRRVLATDAAGTRRGGLAARSYFRLQSAPHRRERLAPGGSAPIGAGAVHSRTTGGAPAFPRPDRVGPRRIAKGDYCIVRAAALALSQTNSSGGHSADLRCGPDRQPRRGNAAGS